MADRQEMRRGYEQAVAARRAALEAELTAERGRVTERDALLLDAICDAEMIRLEAMGQVEAKGLRERYSNGRQTLERENKAVAQSFKAAVTLTKLVTALNAKPRRSKAAEEPEEVETDDLDDY